MPKRLPVFCSVGLKSFETVGSIGPSSAKGCITISSAPKASSVAALYARYGMSTLKLFANSLNKETRRQGTVPLPPLLHRNMSSLATGLDGHKSKWSKKDLTESSAIMEGTFCRKLVRKQITVDPRISSIFLISAILSFRPIPVCLSEPTQHALSGSPSCDHNSRALFIL